MGLRVRKSVKMGPVHVNFSKSGVGVSAGVKGARVTRTADGKTRTTVSVPGTGVSYVKETSSKSGKPGGKAPSGCLTPIVVVFALILAVAILTSACTSAESGEPNASPSESQAIEIDTLAVDTVENKLTALGFRAEARDNGAGRIEADAFVDGLHAEQRPVNWPELRELLSETSQTLHDEIGDSVAIYMKDEAETIVLTVMDGKIIHDAYPDEAVESSASPSVEPSASPSVAPSASAEPSPSPTPSAPPASVGLTYIGNSNTMKFHEPSCSSVDDMKAEHKVTLSSRDSAISGGYSPCGRCKP